MIGFMGSGKTTLGLELARALDVAFVDLDREIETAAGRSVEEIFAQEGEAGFRARELAALEALAVKPPDRCVLATGGGIVESSAARAALQSFGRIVWLQADPDACVARLGAARAQRPLLADAAVWRARYVQREPIYRDLADATVRTHPEHIAASLAALLEVVHGRDRA